MRLSSRRSVGLVIFQKWATTLLLMHQLALMSTLLCYGLIGEHGKAVAYFSHDICHLHTVIPDFIKSMHFVLSSAVGFVVSALQVKD
jgi:hypothetical protein